jgi:hypothetical protein
MLMTMTPTSEQLHNVSSRREFVGNGKGEPFEIKRITVWLDPPKGHEATGRLYLIYSIADIPTSNLRTDNIVDNNHLSTTFSHYLQLDEVFISPHLQPAEVLSRRHDGNTYTGALLPVEWGCMLGTTILAKIEFDMRHTGRYIHQQNPSLKIVTWVTREFSVTWSLSSDLALALQTHKRDNTKHQIVDVI